MASGYTMRPLQRLAIPGRTAETPHGTRYMAKYRTSLIIHRPLADTFAFISDFSNAASWDPQTKSSRKVTQGDIGVGTKFILVGGAVGLNFDLPYEIVSYDPPNQFVLEGETSVFRYRDVIDFVAVGADTRVTYDAELCFRGLLRVGNPFMRLMFQRIGDSATRGMPAAVEAGVPAKPAASE